MFSLWNGLPIVLRAALTGILLSAVGTIPWAVLVALNLQFLPNLPWAVLPTALYLWLYWMYLKGAGWPQSTAEVRRASLRANALSEEVWGAAILAGILGIATLVILSRILNRFIALPQERVEDLSHVPAWSLALILLTSALVAGIVEEASFRGYMQGSLEKRHGPLVAILVTGVVFALAHFTHRETTLIMMPYYLAVAAVYGALAYLTNSILPGLVLHAGGNFLAGVGLLARGHREWQTSTEPTPPIWETGPDVSFWISCFAALVVGTAAVWAYVSLGRSARTALERRNQATLDPVPK